MRANFAHEQRLVGMDPFGTWFSALLKDRKHKFPCNAGVNKRIDS